jgi:hypothetical protein
MATKQEIILAIGAHIWWRNEFERAISDGWYSLNADLAKRDNHSGLGLWLAKLSTAEQDSEHCRVVHSRYADFHEAAAEVARMAASGNIYLAETSIRNGLYAQASIALTLALRDWMYALREYEYIHGLQMTQHQVPKSNRTQLGS